MMSNNSSVTYSRVHVDQGFVSNIVYSGIASLIPVKIDYLIYWISVHFNFTLTEIKTSRDLFRISCDI